MKRARRKVARRAKAVARVASSGTARRGPRKGSARTRYSDQQRREILSTAQREGLTALQVKQRFGVTPVTYYSWRRKGGAAGRRGGKGRAVVAAAAVGRTVAGAMNVADMIRDEIRRHIRGLLPGVIATEVGSAMGGGGGGARRRRRRRRSA